MSRRVIDVSHDIEAGMITYPSLPAPVVSDYLCREASRARYAEGAKFQIGRIEMIANTGAYIDAPLHRFDDGMDSVNIDDAQDDARPGHTLLLGAGIPVVEHLCDLNKLPAQGFRFHCVPVKFRGVGTFPVRAYAVME